MEFHKVTAESVNLILGASRADMAKLYLKLSVKRRLASLNIYFNSKCLKLGVVPGYIQLKTNATTPAALGAISSAKTSWLRNELRQWYIRRNNLSTHLMLLHTELVHAYHPVEWDLIEDHVRWRVGEVSRRKLTRLNDKLKKLSENSSKSNHQPGKPIHRRSVINLSNHQFSTEEMNVLGKSLLFTPCCPPSLRDMKHLSVDCELALRDHDDNVKSLVADIISTHSSTSIAKQKLKIRSAPHVIKVVNNIKRVLQREGLVLCKEDEGSRAVIMNEDDYTSKLNDFLCSSNLQMLTKDPTKKFCDKVKQVVNQILHALTDEQKKLLDSKSLPPKLYGLSRVCEPGYPIKPIVSHIGTPTNKLASILSKIIKNKTKFRPKRGVKNEVELASALKDVVVPDSACLISLKVPNVFFSIPSKEAIELAKGLLSDSEVNEDVVNDLVILMNVCSEQKYFTFRGEFYEQMEGVVMGSPLSHLLVDIFLDNLENSFLKSGQSVVEKVYYWFRHFDHIVCCFDGEEGHRYEFFRALNLLHPNVEFSPKLPINEKLDFLDLSIKLVDNRHVFSVSKRAVRIDRVVPANSWTHFSNKMAPFHSMTTRLLRLPLMENEFSTELRIIKKIARIKGYNDDLIDRMVTRKRDRIALSKIFGFVRPSQQSPVNCSLRHTGVLSYKVANFLSSKLNLRPSFGSDKTLGRLLVNSKEQTEKRKMAGVYKLKCDDCECVYIGKTDNSFDERMLKHKSDKKGAFRNHLIAKNHAMNFNYDILHLENDKERLTELEVMEIRLCYLATEQKSNVLNKLLYRQHSPLLTALKQDKT